MTVVLTMTNLKILTFLTLLVVNIVYAEPTTHIPPYYLLRIASEVSGIPLKNYGEDLDIFLVDSSFDYFKKHPNLLGIYNKKNGHKQIVILNNEATTFGDLNTRIIHEMVHYLQDPDLSCAGMHERGQVELEAYTAENKFRKKYGKYLNITPYDMSEYEYLVEASKTTTIGVCT